MVRLVVPVGVFLFKLVLEFQFHYGTIGCCLMLPVEQYVCCFNSTMVRLVVCSDKDDNSAAVFQFHYGTIGCNGGLGGVTALNEFQFHYGTIG